MTEDTHPPAGSPRPEQLVDIERLAVELAGIAGREITKALGGLLAVRYKTSTRSGLWTDPVSEVDNEVERIIRLKVAESFADHDIIGEEMAGGSERGSDFVWVIDPIDGTTNFVNGFPICAASIGVLHRGVPIVGALWCSVSHELRSGVYHCSAAGKLRFDGADVTPKLNPDVRRRLVGVPSPIASREDIDTRKTGSAAFECAMVAAGLLRAARFATPNIWDIAGGIALVRAGGGAAYRRAGALWRPLDRFSPHTSLDALAAWQGEVVIGEAEAAREMCDSTLGLPTLP